MIPPVSEWHYACCRYKVQVVPCTGLNDHIQLTFQVRLPLQWILTLYLLASLACIGFLIFHCIAYHMWLSAIVYNPLLSPPKEQVTVFLPIYAVKKRLVLVSFAWVQMGISFGCGMKWMWYSIFIGTKVEFYHLICFWWKW